MTGAAHHQELLNIAPPAQSNLVGVEHQVEAVGELGAAHIAVGSANLVLQEEDFSSLHGIGGLQTLVIERMYSTISPNRESSGVRTWGTAPWSNWTGTKETFLIRLSPMTTLT